MFNCCTKIIGGDETGGGCNLGCVKNYHEGPCLRCGNNWESHSAHICPIGGRGSWNNENETEKKKKCTALQLVKTLIDAEGAGFKVRGAEVLPAMRIAVYAAHEHLKEEDRLLLWEFGTMVTEDPKQLITWVSNMSQWGATDDIVSNIAPENNDDIPAVPPPLLKRESSGAENLKLAAYRAELEDIEQSKAVFADAEEQSRKELQSRAIASHRILVNSVEERIYDLQKQMTKLKDMLPITHLLKTKKASCNPNSGRDAALAFAWFEGFSGSDGLLNIKEIEKHYYNLNNEINSLSQMLLAVKVVAYVVSPLHKKLLNLSHSWLRTFLPHCLAKINRVR